MHQIMLLHLSKDFEPTYSPENYCLYYKNFIDYPMSKEERLNSWKNVGWQADE